MGRNVSYAVCAFAAMFAAVSCAGTRARVSAPDSGFLGDTSMLRPAADDSAARIWFDPGVNFVAYDRLLIDPVAVALVPGAEAAEVDPEVLGGLAAEFRATLVRVVDPYYEVLDGPAPRTIRVRAALTDAKLRRGGATGADLAAARVEWEALDATTGRRIGAGVRWRETRSEAPGFDPWAEALLDLMISRRDLGVSASR